MKQPENEVKGTMELVVTRVTLSQGDKRDGVSEWHFIEQFGCIVQEAELNIRVEENVLGEQVERKASLENVAVHALPRVWVAVADRLLEHVGIGMGIQCICTTKAC